MTITGGEVLAFYVGKAITIVSLMSSILSHGSDIERGYYDFWLAWYSIYMVHEDVCQPVDSTVLGQGPVKPWTVYMFCITRRKATTWNFLAPGHLG